MHENYHCPYNLLCESEGQSLMCSVGMRVTYFWPCFTILPWCWQTNVPTHPITHPPLSPRLIDTKTLLTLRAHLGFIFSLRFTLSLHATPYVWVHCSPLANPLRQRLGCPPSERNCLSRDKGPFCPLPKVRRTLEKIPSGGGDSFGDGLHGILSAPRTNSPEISVSIFGFARETGTFLNR